MRSKYPRAGRVIAELVLDDGERPGQDRFWERRPSSPEVTRLGSSASAFDDAQLGTFAEGTMPPGLLRAATRQPTADLE